MGGQRAQGGPSPPEETALRVPLGPAQAWEWVSVIAQNPGNPAG